MTRRIVYSVIVGFILLLLSLVHKTGALEPMPYINGGCGQGGVCGVVALPPGGVTAPTSLAKRGFPLPAVSLRADEDSPNNYYKSLNVVNVLVDFALFSVIAFCVLSLPVTVKRPSKKS